MLQGASGALEHQGSFLSLPCALLGRGTLRDPILGRIMVENPTVSGGLGQLGFQGSRAARATAPQMGGEMLGVPCPTPPSLFSGETHFPDPLWPVLLLKGVIHRADKVTRARQPSVPLHPLGSPDPQRAQTAHTEHHHTWPRAPPTMAGSSPVCPPAAAGSVRKLKKKNPISFWPSGSA